MPSRDPNPHADVHGPSGGSYGAPELAPHGEAFPRGWLSERIAHLQWSESSRTRWQSPLISFGLALLALGLPTSRLLGQGPELVRLTDASVWIHGHLLLQPIANILSWFPGVGAERAWFLISALCWAGSFSVLFSTCLGLGFRRGVSLAGVLIAMTAPAVWLAGTLPGSAGPGLLGSSLLMRVLLGPWMAGNEVERRTAPLRAAASWLLASLLHISLVLVFPAVVLAVARRDWSKTGESAGTSEAPAADRANARAMWAFFAAPFLLLAALAVAALLAPAPNSGLAFLEDALSLVRGGDRGRTTDWIVWLLLLVPSLGPSAVGLWHLTVLSHDASTKHPPVWLLVWSAFPVLFQLLGGSPSLDLAAIVLGPLLPIGLTAWLAGGKRASLPLRGMLLAGCQIALLVGSCLALSASDPERAWRNLAERELMADDLLLTRSRTHHHLLRLRLGVQCIDLGEPKHLRPEEQIRWWAEVNEEAETAHAEGRRVVFDGKMGATIGGRRYPFEQELRRLFFKVPVVMLEEQRR